MFAAVDHQVVSGTVAMYRMEHIVILCEFGRSVVIFTFAVLIVRVIAAAAFHTTMHPLLIHLVDEFDLLLIIEVIDRSIFHLNLWVSHLQAHSLQGIQITYSQFIGMADLTCLQEMDEELLDEVDG